MSLKLSCSCIGRFIRHDIHGPHCSKCGTPATEDSPPAKVYRQLDVDYACPVTGKPIRSKKAHEENLRLHGCHVLETGEKENAQRNYQRAEKEFDAAIEQTVEEEIAKLPPEKLQQLAAEVATTDVQITRANPQVE